ncbi:MAG: hypothetical protein WC856_02790 [Methylococcaceae bacterium]
MKTTRAINKHSIGRWTQRSNADTYATLGACIAINSMKVTMATAVAAMEKDNCSHCCRCLNQTRQCKKASVRHVAASINQTTVVQLKKLAMKEYRKRNDSGAVYDDPRVAVEAGCFDGVGA